MFLRTLWQLMQLAGATGYNIRISSNARTWSLVSTGRLNQAEEGGTAAPELTERASLIHPQEVPAETKLVRYSKNGLSLAGAAMSGGPALFTMADLLTDAMDMLLRDAKNPEFRTTWAKVVNEGDWKLGVAISVGFVLSYAGMGLFNIFNTQLTIKNLLTKKNPDMVDARDGILKAADACDTAVGAFLKFVFGLPVGSMLDKAWQEELLVTTPISDLWGTVSAGIPIQKVVQIFLVEVPRTVHCAATFFSPLKCFAGSDSPRALRLELLNDALNAINVLQLTPQVFLNHIDPKADITEIVAQLLVIGESKRIELGFKKFLTEFVFFPAGISIAWPATPFFEILGKAAVLAIMKPLNIDVESDAAQKAAEIMGKVSRWGFFALWSLLLKDSLIRPMMRLVSRGKWSHEAAADSFIKRISNCQSWSEAALHILSMMCGAAIGISNLPLIAPGPDYDTTAINAFTANTAVSVNGFMGFLKMTGLFGMKADVYDTVGGALFKFYGDTATMSKDETQEKVMTIRERVTELRNASSHVKIEEVEVVSTIIDQGLISAQKVSF